MLEISDPCNFLVLGFNLAFASGVTGGGQLCQNVCLISCATSVDDGSQSCSRASAHCDGECARTGC